MHFRILNVCLQEPDMTPHLFSSGFMILCKLFGFLYLELMFFLINLFLGILLEFWTYLKISSDIFYSKFLKEVLLQVFPLELW